MAAVLLLCLACALVYAGRLDGPFILDDQTAIVQNPTIRHLATLDALRPPRETPVAGRPLANLSLALDLARAGLQPAAFHATNLLLHLLVALLGWATLQRTLALERMPEGVRARAPALALAAVLLFAVHPMSVEIVLYATQRTESLAALAYLGALYLLLRAAEQGAPRLWPFMALVGLAGVASKEVFATAPVVLLFFDRALVAGSFRRALGERKALHLALALCWLALAWLQIEDTRPGSVRFADLDYLLAQSRIIPEYLLTALWPAHPVPDYGPLVPASASGAWPWLCALGLLVLALAALAFTHPRAGFIGVWVLGILAPSSSLLSIHTEVGAERRFYLPLLGLSAGLALAGDALLRLAARRWGRSSRIATGVGIGILIAATALLAARARNHAAVFGDARLLWSEAVRARPKNPRAHYNLGETLRQQGELGNAESALRKALALHEGYADAHSTLGGVLLGLGREQEALEHIERAVTLAPDDPRARFNYGLALGRAGRIAESARELNAVVRLDPGRVEARRKLGFALGELGRIDQARAQVDWLLARDPEDGPARALLRWLQAQERARSRPRSTGDPGGDPAGDRGAVKP